MYPGFAIGLSIVVVALGIAWWLTTRVQITPKRVPLMTQRIAFPGGLRLHEPELALARLDQPEEIVIPFEKATLVISYPLSTPASAFSRESTPFTTLLLSPMQSLSFTSMPNQVRAPSINRGPRWFSKVCRAWTKTSPRVKLFRLDIFQSPTSWPKLPERPTTTCRSSCRSEENRAGGASHCSSVPLP